LRPAHAARLGGTRGVRRRRRSAVSAELPEDARRAEARPAEQSEEDRLIQTLIVGGVDVPEAPVEQTEHGLVCKGDGWFVVNAQELRWYESEGWGRFSNFGGDTVFEQLGFGITVLGPGQPLSMYHWETDQEDFLVLYGTGTLI